ncbi:MAG: hypothetical protein U0W40_07320 [Acidimicrobiia bacterium]
MIARRSRVLGFGLLAAVALFFGSHLVTDRQLVANVADVEHLVALLTGALVEWRLSVQLSLSAPAPGPATLAARA